MKIFSIVPEKCVFVLERFGKFQRLLNPGFRVMIPFIDQIAYKQHLMEQCIYSYNLAVDIEKQTAIHQSMAHFYVMEIPFFGYGVKLWNFVFKHIKFG